MKRAIQSDWDRRANNFDLIRLALAILVIYSHSYPLGGTPESQEPLMRWSHGQMTGGAIAVDLFFIMSGFLIAASAERSRSIFEFMRKRVFRIYPAFVVAAVLTAFFVVPYSGAAFDHESWIARLGNFLMQTVRLREFSYSGAFATNPYPGAINGSVWSIQYEFWCYVGVAWLLAVGLLRRRWLLLGLFALSLTVSVLFQVHGWIFGGKIVGRIVGSPQLWARLLPLYLAGVVFYLFRDKIPLNKWLVLLSALTLVVASFVRFGWVACLPVAGAYLVFTLAFSPAIRFHRFGRFGDFSYGTYLYAFPIQQLLVRAFARPVAPGLLFTCAAPLALLAAVASWYGVERRFLQPSRRNETASHALKMEQQVA